MCQRCQLTGAGNNFACVWYYSPTYITSTQHNINHKSAGAVSFTSRENQKRMLWLRLAWPKIYFHVRSLSSPSRRHVLVLARRCIYSFWNKNQNNTIKTLKTFECELIEMILFYFFVVQEIHKPYNMPTKIETLSKPSRNNYNLCAAALLVIRYGAHDA